LSAIAALLVYCVSLLGTELHAAVATIPKTLTICMGHMYGWRLSGERPNAVFFIYEQRLGRW